MSGTAARHGGAPVDAHEGRERELEEHRVADELFEVDHVAIERVGLAVDRVVLVEFADRDDEVAGEIAETDAAVPRPVRADLPPSDDALGHALEHEVEGDGAVDTRGGPAEVHDHGFAGEGSPGARVGEEVGDVDAEIAHGS